MKSLVANIGAGGRMGRAVTQLLLNHPDLELVTAISRPGSQYIGQDAGILAGRPAAGIMVSDKLDEVIAHADVVIDFSHPDLAVRAAQESARQGKPLVCGTTGLNSDQYEELAAAARKIPLLFAPNMSIGMNLLYKMLEIAASRLGVDYDVEISDIHDRHKRDAPSGTALKLGELVAAARNQRFDDVMVKGRSGMDSKRAPGDIGMTSLRVGETVAEHTVYFANSEERIELTHRSFNRDTFAGGALRAALWLLDQKAGLYGMSDALDL